MIDNGLHPFRPKDVLLPEDPSGYCYILLSLQDGHTSYIGQTMKLVVQLNQHNLGFGSNQTSDPHLHPWALLAFVCSFGGECHLLHQFEKDWQAKQNRMLSSGDVRTPADIADLGRAVISDWQWDEIAMGLHYVSMGTFSKALDSSDI